MTLPVLDPDAGALPLPVASTVPLDAKLAASLDVLPTSGWPPSLRTHLFLSVLQN